MWFVPWTLLALAVSLEYGWVRGVETLIFGSLVLYIFGGMPAWLKLAFIGLGLFVPLGLLLFGGRYRSRAFLLLTLTTGLTVAPLVADQFGGVPMELTNGCSVGCNSNLKNIATALESYSVDNGGRYPSELTELTPQYLKIVPKCISRTPSELGKRTYARMGVEFNEYAYQQRAEPDGYLISCQTGVHPSPKGYPQYDSVTGLVGLPDRTP